jgi:hypothetical protein
VRPKWQRAQDSAASCHTAAAIEALRQADPERDMEPASDTPVHDDQYVLFFDGGSRGNPGPGGSGAVIIKTNQRATQTSIIWSAAMSAAQATTTNNQAEYAGAVTGLRAAHDNDWAPLEIVGDKSIHPSTTTGLQAQGWESINQ